MNEMKSENLGQEEGKSEEEERKIFIEEIEKIKREDLERGTPAHLFDVNPQNLTMEDAAIWQKVKDGSILPEDFKRYDLNFKDEKGERREDIPIDRLRFRAFIANKAQVIFTERQLREELEQ